VHVKLPEYFSGVQQMLVVEDPAMVSAESRAGSTYFFAFQATNGRLTNMAIQ
jgi:hypothetical protein